jgi:hypothetical protein
MYHRFGSAIYSSYGFLDAFNASFHEPTDSLAVPQAPAPGAPAPGTPGYKGWVDPDYVGIDEGPIVAMIENYRSDLVWRVMRSDPYLRQGLERAGFSGGWLAPAQ